MSKEAHDHCYDVAENVNHVKEVRVSEITHDAISSVPKAVNDDIRKTRLDFVANCELRART